MSHTFFISANESNPEAELALNVLVSNIIELATAHANSLNIGNPTMEHLGAGWVLSRLTVEVSEYPKVNTNYTLTTWVEAWNRHYSVRDFAIADENGKTIGYARSVWMVLNMSTHENFGLSHLTLPDDIISTRECPIAPQGKHTEIFPFEYEDAIPPKALKATEEETFYTFQYNDIDFYRHVNTVRYITLLNNQFTLDDFDRRYVQRIEISFLREGNYGVTAEIRRHHDTATGFTSFSVLNHADDTPIIFARVRLAPRPTEQR